MGQKKQYFSQEELLLANAGTGVELGVYKVAVWPERKHWRTGYRLKTRYECRWRPTGGEEWSVRSEHLTPGAATKELIRLRDNSTGLTFSQK